MATRRLPASPVEENIDNIPFVDEDIVSVEEPTTIPAVAVETVATPTDTYVDPTALSDKQLEAEFARRTAQKEAEKDAMLEEYKKLGVKEYTKKKLELQEKVQVFIPFDMGEGVRRDRNGRLVRPVSRVGINGITFEVIKGMPQMVPADIAKRIQSSVEADGIPTPTYGQDLAISPEKDIRQVKAD